jgi:hypothetical protein
MVVRGMAIQHLASHQDDRLYEMSLKETMWICNIIYWTHD